MFYLFQEQYTLQTERERKRRREREERERETQKAPTCSPAASLQKCPQQPGLSWAKSKSQKLNPSLPYGRWEANYLRHTCCLPGSAFQESEACIKARYSNVGNGHPNFQDKCSHRSLSIIKQNNLITLS